jgi:hypothetical protein
MMTQPLCLAQSGAPRSAVAKMCTSSAAGCSSSSSCLPHSRRLVTSVLSATHATDLRLGELRTQADFLRNRLVLASTIRWRRPSPPGVAITSSPLLRPSSPRVHLNVPIGMPAPCPLLPPHLDVDPCRVGLLPGAVEC